MERRLQWMSVAEGMSTGDYREELLSLVAKMALNYLHMYTCDD